MEDFENWRAVDFSKRAIPDDLTGNGDPDFLKSRIPENDAHSHLNDHRQSSVGPWIVILVSIGFIALGLLSW
ncbi:MULTISPECIES: hypothetical protein [Sphingomonadaceae]|uniref:hypothetical protein n=1 Tax=Sphingomonadales TaxID=204457 RepID=UPI0012E3EEC7|nr:MULTISPECIES: hypothetical protein [Sphingomonadaceae]